MLNDIVIVMNVPYHCPNGYEAPELKISDAEAHCLEPGTSLYVIVVDMTPAFLLVGVGCQQNRSVFEHCEALTGMWSDLDLIHSTSQTSWQNLCLLLSLDQRQKFAHVTVMKVAVVFVRPVAEAEVHNLDQVHMGYRLGQSPHHPRPGFQSSQKVLYCFGSCCCHRDSRVLLLADVRCTGAVW
jgi:hypothetical protein